MVLTAFVAEGNRVEGIGMSRDDYRNSELESADDRIIAARAADGDRAAFAVLVRRYTPMMRAYSRRILNGGHEVDDVVQEAFFTAWDQLSTLSEPSKVKTWLMRIVSRKSLDRIKSSRPEAALNDLEPPAAEQHSPERLAEARAGIADLSKALSALPPRERECWLLREFGGYTYEEISEDLGVPLATVRGLLARARKGIIARMEQWR